MTHLGSGAGGFAINELKCPSCGGALHLVDGMDTTTCSFCDSVVHVSYRKQETGIDPDGSIRDPATGTGMFRVRMPAGWRVTSASLQRTGSISRPYIPQVEFGGPAGGIASLRVGDAGTRNSAGLNMLMGIYGGHLAGIDTANYADMPDPIALANSTAGNLAARLGASNCRFVAQLPPPNLETKLKVEYERFQRTARAEGGSVTNPFMAVVLRTYDMSCNGRPWKAAVCIELAAVKLGGGIGEGMGMGMAGGLGGLADSIGSLFGKPKRANPAPQQFPQQQMGGVPSVQGVAWCSSDMAQYTQGGTIFWSVSTIATYAAPANDFDTQLLGMFVPLVGGYELHPDVEGLALAAGQEYSARVQCATQSQIARNQAAFEAQQAAMRQRQAAFDSYNQSVMAAQDAHHRQFMASSHSSFGHSSPDFSEAIRGVNTYVTSDGREVELSVQADRAYENQAGDVIGTSGGFEPGASWTEIPRT